MIKLNAVFEEIDPPPSQANLPVCRVATWCTWSADCRRLFKSWSSALNTLPRPRRKRLLGGKAYDYTLSVPFAEVDESFASEFVAFAACLYDLPTPKGIVLLSELFGDFLDGAMLPRFISLLREALVVVSGNEMCALYAPLSAVGIAAGDFPLHADLYIPELLLNIFEDVPDGSSGKSLFLSVDAFTAILDSLADLPFEISALIRSKLSDPLNSDGYEEFFELLHGEPPNLWRLNLQTMMETQAFRIKLQKGQGYLIHDRSWLHGREQPSGGVSRKRLHRLVFNNRERQIFRLRAL